MSTTNRLISVLILAAGASLTQAQDTFPLYTKTHCVQVRYEMWRNGATYWDTKFETSDLEEAQLMHDLLQIALDDGSLCEIFNCGFDWIIVDVRIRTKYEWHIYPIETWQPNVYQRRF